MTPDFIAKAPIQEIVSERSMTSANAEQFLSSYSESNLEFMFPIFINNLITSGTYFNRSLMILDAP